MRTDKKYWFPAKRRGYGWGPPEVWQGWAIIVGIIVANAVGAILLMPVHVGGFLCVVIGTVLLMLVICYVKGEPPAWG